MNICVLVGRIATDLELKYTTSGLAVINFRLAVDRQRKSEDGQKQTDFLDIVAFGKTAELVAQYLDKGSLTGIEGRIQARDWQTSDGQPRRSVEVIANSVQFLESRQEAERRRAAKGVSGPPGVAAQPPPAAAAPAPQAQPPPAAAAPAPQAQPPPAAAPAPAPAAPAAPAPSAPPPADQEYGAVGDDEDPFGDQ